MRTVVRVLLLAALVAFMGGCEGDDSGPPVPDERIAVSLESAFPYLVFSRPLALLQAPGNGDWWYVLEQGGKVLRFRNSALTTSTELVADISGWLSGANEGGLLGMAFHPRFQQNGLVYLSFTSQGNPLLSVIARLVSPDGGITLDLASRRDVLHIAQPFKNHNGGTVAFGADGYLYISSGDGGGSGDPFGNAQRVDNLLGKILRINVDAGDPYAIPSDNPFAAGGGSAEIFAWGLRNPWKFSFDASGGALWAGDVGQGAREEINIIQKGLNYGWNIKEGNACFLSVDCDDSGLTAPVHDYTHDIGRSVTGGYVYRGSLYPELRGVYFFADFISGRLWAMIRPYQPDRLVNIMQETGLKIATFGESNDGELYVADYSGGTIHHLVHTPPAISP